MTPTQQATATEQQKTHGKPRSPHWPKVRKLFLASNPTCAVCAGKRNLEVHHVKPFHLHPELELDFSNLITLCESKGDGCNCHLLFGHLGNFSSYNADVRADSVAWASKMAHRPAGGGE